MLLVASGLLTALVLVAIGLAVPYWRLAGQFGEQPLKQPSRLYGRAAVLEVDAPFPAEQLLRRLVAQGYREASGGELEPGEFRVGGRRSSHVEIFLRSFRTPQGKREAAVLRVELDGPIVSRLVLAGESLETASLEPPMLTSFYGPELQDRRPVALSEVPEHLIQAVLAAEDATFYSHPGLSGRGILRAVWANFRGGGVRQGGSTLTQQLVKNLFLTHERSLLRKAREAGLALVLELRHSKQEILEAYLNEIYWGRSGSVSLMGVGSASWAYFGKRPAELTVAESALLAALIRSPNGYQPERHPERALERRDWVLDRMAKLELLPQDVIDAARAEPLGARLQDIDLGFARYAADAVADEVRDRFGIASLDDRGYSIWSTLDLEDQLAAEEAVGWGLAQLEKQDGNKKTQGPSPLEAALLSVDPRTGAILAYLGGRDYGTSQFDRVRFARRQPGSAFKPFVYLAAFADRVASPATLLEDGPLTLTNGTQTWSPRNDDGRFRGPVTARRALEESINVPTVRLADAVGYRRVVDWARAVGIASRLDPVPSLALGSFEVTPRELLTAYSTLAAGGRRPELFAVVAVRDAQGQPVPGSSQRPPQAVLAPEVAYVTTTVLQGVLDRGTGRSSRFSGLYDSLAGKTGTSSDRRDNWFVGYSPDRATLVWVGHDDATPTRLSGARAALPIWSRFARARRPPLGYPAFQPPDGVVTVAVDPATGERATSRCPEIVTEVFLYDQVPVYDCYLHGGKRARRHLDEPPDGERRRRFLDRIFGRRSRARPVI